MIREREVFVTGFDQVHRPIKPAVNGEIAAQRREVGIRLVADAQGEQIGAGAGKLAGDFETKGAEGAAMFAEQLAIQINFRLGAGGFKTQKIKIGRASCRERVYM